MILEHVTACPGCEHREFTRFLESNGFIIVRCNSCDLLFVNPRPAETAVKQLFAEDYIGDETRVREHFINWRAASLKREAAIIRQRRPDGGALLDIGTASGAFLRHFAEMPQWRLEGIEPSRVAAEAASASCGIRVRQGFLQEQKFPPALFDVVTSLDAFFFHLNPTADMAEISRIIKPGGLLAIEIPGLRFRLLKNSGLLCRLIYGVPTRLNAGVHLFYYSRQTLGRMVGRHGFVEVAVFPEQSPLRGSLLLRFCNHVFYRCAAALYWMTGGLVNVAPKEFILYEKTQA